MIHNHLVLVSFLFVLSINLPYSQALRPPHDKKVLLRIKKYLGNPYSLSSWDPNTDPCGDWIGVECNSQGRVNLVVFYNDQGIRGPIPPFLHQLPYLRWLSLLYLPNLSGPIPPYVGKLTNLKKLIIHRTNISGPIPRFLGQLTNLESLSLNSNKFTGPVPNFLTPLKNLVHLSLNSNQLTGQLSTALAHLPNLTSLSLSSNRLCGQIPNSIAQNLKDLNRLALDSNYLSGPIPTSLGLLSNLGFLNLSANHLSGAIPKSLGRINLGFLYLSQNKLTGDASFLFNKNIIYLWIADNLLKFNFTNVEFGDSLGVIDISHNMIYGSLPEGFGRLQPRFVDVSYNQLCGPIPNGERFKTADPIIFAHNKCLCGGPLPACK